MSMGIRSALSAMVVFCQAAIVLAGPQSATVGGLVHELSERSHGSFAAELAAPAKSATAPTGGEEPLAPSSTIAKFQALNFAEDGALTGSFHIPPDPHGAAGPNHVVAVINTSIFWAEKDGSNQASNDLGGTGGHFTSLANDGFDPKVIYDNYDNRFVVVVLERDAGLETSRILVGVSDDSNPNGTWYSTVFDAEQVISLSDTWADYPGLAVDDDNIYVTVNQFLWAGGVSQGVRLWVLTKSGLYSGGSPTSSTVFDPVTAAGAFNITFMPAQPHGTLPGSVGTWLMGYNGLSNSVQEFIQIVRLDDPFGTPAWNTQTISIGDIENTAVVTLPDAPQLGSATDIEVNDRRALEAVWRNDTLYLSTTILPGSGANSGETTAYWAQFDTTTLSALSFTQGGEVGGESIATGCYTYFPSIAVNQFDDLAIGFCASAPTIYAGSYYTSRTSGDTAGSTSSPQTLQAGTDHYVRIFPLGGGTRNRWGDYTGTAVDPADDATFWVFNQNAMTRGNLLNGEDGQWDTYFGSFTESLVPVELDVFNVE